MKNLATLIAVFFIFPVPTNAQSYFTKNGRISFFSKTPLENIDAVNNQTVSIINSKTGDLAFSVLVTGFLFKKGQMQEHFNEEYLESTKYPKATFNGKITDMDKINFTRNGAYPVTVTGDLVIHGISHKVTVPATLGVNGNKITANAVFPVLLADYKISIPAIVEDNISKTIEIKVDCTYDPK